MIRKKLILESWLTVLNALLPLLASCLTYLARFHGHDSWATVDMHAYLLLIFAITLAWNLGAWYYRLGRLENSDEFEKRLLKASLFTATVLFAITFTYRSAAYSRGFVLCLPVVLFCLAYLAQNLFHLSPFLERRTYPVAIIGSQDMVLSLAKELISNQFFSGHIAGCVALPGKSIYHSPYEVLPFEELSYVVKGWRCEEIYIAIRPSELELLSELQDQIASLCLPSRMVVGGQRHPFQSEIHSFGGLEVVNLFEHPLDSVSYVIWKKIFDMLFSIAVLALTAPLLMVIALAIKLSSPGPVLFRQERIGYKNKPFMMYKFRTMCVQTNGDSDCKHTQHADPRITRVGHLLRRTSFDELPQFFNVLKGEMSVVGPRPELTFFVHKFREEIPSYLFRHHVMCGITGWAQVNGLRGSHTSIPQRIEYDLEYVRNWSLSLDLQIIAKTVTTGFAGKNAI
jgi:Undecaprenyl-phosphate glucose phosphotransferase